MKTYQGSEIRNVAVVGHAHCGKTTLIAALLHAAKMTPTQGRVEDGSAATAYDEEEVARGITMQNAVAIAEWQGVKINFVDTPGFHMFTHEARAALFPVESAIVVVNAQNGIEPITERVWRFAEEANVPRIVLVNQMDHPKAGGGGGLSSIFGKLGYQSDFSTSISSQRMVPDVSFAASPVSSPYAMILNGSEIAVGGISAATKVPP